MRALVIEQDPTEKAALVGRSLERRGFELVPWTVQAEPISPLGRTDYPDADGFGLIVSLGSPWSVYDETVSHWVQPQPDLLRAATETGVPVLGICFGSQALATALGGRVRRAEGAEVGWRTVHSPVRAIAGTWFQWHHDVFEVPPGAQAMAHSDFGPQAFRLGRSLALQFHPEVDADHLDFWLDSGGRAEIEKHGVDADGLLSDTRARQVEMAVRVDRLVDWFLAL